MNPPSTQDLGCLTPSAASLAFPLCPCLLKLKPGGCQLDELSSCQTLHLPSPCFLNTVKGRISPIRIFIFTVYNLIQGTHP